jgi:molybdopterin converting factor subunit 1
MTVNILAFGIAKEILGSATTALPLSDVLTVEGLKAELEKQYPRLKQLTSFMIAVNGEYAAANTIVKTGDEVAIIPPVSGG